MIINYVPEYDAAYFGRHCTFTAVRNPRFIKVIHSMHRKRGIKKRCQNVVRTLFANLNYTFRRLQPLEVTVSIMGRLVNHVWEIIQRAAAEA
jgi:hypothetical protein